MIYVRYFHLFYNGPLFLLYKNATDLIYKR